MENIKMTDILYFIGAITTIVTFILWLSKPYKSIQEKLTSEEQKINDLSNTLKAQQKLLNSSLKVQMLLMEHVIYGNHVDIIKQELSHLQNDIIDAKS